MSQKRKAIDELTSSSSDDQQQQGNEKKQKIDTAGPLDIKTPSDSVPEEMKRTCIHCKRIFHKVPYDDTTHEAYWVYYSADTPHLPCLPCHVMKHNINQPTSEIIPDDPCTVILRHMPTNQTEQAFIEKYKSFGHIENLSLVCARDTGRATGTVIVSFDNASSAQKLHERFI